MRPARRRTVLMIALSLAAGCDGSRYSSPTASRPRVPETWSGVTNDVKEGTVEATLRFVFTDGSRFEGTLDRVHPGGYREGGRVHGNSDGSVYVFTYRAHDPDSSCLLAASFRGVVSGTVMEGTFTGAHWEYLCRAEAPVGGAFRVQRRDE